MLLNALLTEPEEVVEKSLYALRAGDVAGTFLYCVGIMAGVIFVFALLASLRAGEAPSGK